MARRKQSAQGPARDENERSRQERDAQEILDLPNREAMSILSGLPSMPGLPAGLLGDQSGAPALDGGSTTPTDPSTTPVDPSAAPATGDINTISPTNQSTLTNLNSSGTTETTGAIQDVPITQQS